MQTNARTKVSEVMASHGLLTIGEDASLSAASYRMAWGKLRHLPVVRGDQVVGIISESDLMRWRAERGTWEAEGARVAAAMSTPAVVTVPDEEIGRAAATMVAGRFGCLPVVDHGRLVGILTSTDLVGWHASQQLAPTGPTELSAGDLMSDRVFTVRSDDPLSEAVDLMGEKHIRHLPVVDATGRLVGMVSDRDLRTFLGLSADTLSVAPVRLVGYSTVSRVMTKGVFAVTPTDSWRQVLATMLGHDVGAVPVVDDAGVPLGIISYVDVLRACTRGAFATEQPAAT